MYIVKWLGYEPPFNEFETQEKARKYLRERIKEDVNRKSSHCKVKHNKDHYEVKIGGKQGFHTYSEGWIVKA